MPHLIQREKWKCFQRPTGHPANPSVAGALLKDSRLTHLGSFQLWVSNKSDTWPQQKVSGFKSLIGSRKKWAPRDFPGGPVVKNPFQCRGWWLIPGPGPKAPQASGQLSLCSTRKTQSSQNLQNKKNVRNGLLELSLGLISEIKKKIKHLHLERGWGGVPDIGMSVL